MASFPSIKRETTPLLSNVTELAESTKNDQRLRQSINDARAKIDAAAASHDSKLELTLRRKLIFSLKKELENSRNSSLHHELEILVRESIQKFVENRRLRDNLDYIGIWTIFDSLLAADNVEVYQFLWTNEIGRQNANYYKRWAFALETRYHKFAEAKAVYNMGLNKIQPTNHNVHGTNGERAELQLCVQEFEKRMEVRVNSERNAGSSSSTKLKKYENIHNGQHPDIAAYFANSYKWKREFPAERGSRSSSNINFNTNNNPVNATQTPSSSSNTLKRRPLGLVERSATPSGGDIISSAKQNLKPTPLNNNNNNNNMLTPNLDIFEDNDHSNSDIKVIPSRGNSKDTDNNNKNFVKTPVPFLKKNLDDNDPNNNDNTADLDKVADKLNHMTKSAHHKQGDNNTLFLCEFLREEESLEEYRAKKYYTARNLPIFGEEFICSEDERVVDIHFPDNRDSSVHLNSNLNINTAHKSDNISNRHSMLNPTTPALTPALNTPALNSVIMRDADSALRDLLPPDSVNNMVARKGSIFSAGKQHEIILGMQKNVKNNNDPDNNNNLSLNNATHNDSALNNRHINMNESMTPSVRHSNVLYIP